MKPPIPVQDLPNPQDAPPPLLLPLSTLSDHSAATFGMTTANGLADAEDSVDGNDDTSSEMELSSAPSRSPSPERPQRTPITGVKRKASDAPETPDDLDLTLEDAVKRAKTSASPTTDSAMKINPIERFPPELWQQVFLRMSPAMLARCLSLSKKINYYLTSLKGAQFVPKKDQRKVRVLDSDFVWAEARKNYFPNLPRPLRGHNELSMLQLIAGKNCQFCNKPPVPSPAPAGVFNAGPGANGVRVIWPFGIRTCGSCWEQHTLKVSPHSHWSSHLPLIAFQDVEILITRAGALRNGLAYAFRTPDLHFIPDIQRGMQGSIPSHLRASKVYYKPEVDEIVREQEEISDFGEGAAGEWQKGLADKGKHKMADAARWERWEHQLGYGSNLVRVLREYDLVSFPQYQEASVLGKSAPVGVSSAGFPAPLPLAAPYGKPRLSPMPPSLLLVYIQFSTHTTSNSPHFIMHSSDHRREEVTAEPNPSFAGLPLPLPFPPQGFPPMGYPPSINGFASQPPPFPPPHLPFYPPIQQRAWRDPQEVETACQLRKAEIERRCLALSPPLAPAVLQHIEAFQAALQISSPLDDAQWEVLKPRLLAGREAAELIEHERETRVAALRAAVPDDGGGALAFLKPAKEVYDAAYEAKQEPLRQRLAEFADEVMETDINKENAPAFAVKVISHVRKRYLEAKAAGTLPKSEEYSSGKTGANGVEDMEPFLSLDNMKWVYDNKVRPVTDPHKKDLFICAGCTEERKPKWFAFEGLIQHYGAKHTTAFSKGNIIVHWQISEWPDEPPFSTNPGAYMKLERKFPDFKNQNRARGTPQHQTGAYTLPSPRDKSSMASSSHHHSTNGYLPPGYGPQRMASWQQPALPLPQPCPDHSHDAQIAHLSAVASELWNTLDGIKDMLECVRAQTVLHHTLLRFSERFGHPPDLDLFTDALARNPLMRGLKNAHGLACKLCVASQPDRAAAAGIYYARIRAVRLYNASSLITHFKIVHEGSGLDWGRDMIEVPEPSLIGELISKPGMDDAKLALIAAAFPAGLPWPLPVIGTVTEEDVAKKPKIDVGPDSGLANRLLKRLEKKVPIRKKKGGAQSNGQSSTRSGSESLPEVGVDEYDPRKPEGASVAPAGDEEEDEAAKFDSDVARKKKVGSESATTGSAPPPQLPFELNAETLAALTALQGGLWQASPQQPAPAMEDRSPSVGRAEPVSSLPPATSAEPENNGLPAQAPDISAILSALTGHLPQPQQPQNLASPPATVTNSRVLSPGPKMQYHYPQYAPPPPPPPQQSAPPPQVAQPPPSAPVESPYAYHQYTPAPHPIQESPRVAYRPDSGRPSSRYAHPDPGPYDPQELQAALARNVAGYGQNRHAQAYVAPPISPPRYRVVYDEEPPAHPAYAGYPPAPAPQPLYREAQPALHYAPPAPQQHYYQSAPKPTAYAYAEPHRHATSAPPPTYVDEYGRPMELIPIVDDAPPAPVQYKPHPYELAQQHRAQLPHSGERAYAPDGQPQGDHGQWAGYGARYA